MAPKSAGLPTRERILAYMEEHHTASVQVLSRAWRLTPANIRYHLGTLLEEGMIEVVHPDPSLPAKRGRPAQYYRLSTSAAADNFSALSAALLRVLLASTCTTETEQVLRAAAEQLAAEAQLELRPSAPPVQHLNRSVDFLSQHGYRARWEASPDGPRVLLRACPYAAILDQHPELCQIDKFLLEALVKHPFGHTVRMNPQTGRPPACVFNPHNPSKSKHLTEKQV